MANIINIVPTVNSYKVEVNGKLSVVTHDRNDALRVAVDRANRLGGATVRFGK